MAIAVIGMACRYPDAATPQQLWENVLAQRRAFRPIPSERLALEDYRAAGPANDPDSTYVRYAGLLEAYSFDRVRYRVGASSFAAADLCHWLALDVAADALQHAGLTDATPQQRRNTGVLLGNSLTGEFSRASQLRLRWPYVRRQLSALLDARGWNNSAHAELLQALETRFKRPFVAPDEETLAGGLSNTIAGRICNHFGFNGGGFTVDGACASSLLAVAQACSALSAGDLDIALAGGVDLSLDPFELVGFARTGALAVDQMRIYDAHPTGFLPGEGCGVVVLMRHDEAQAQGRTIHALIRGWGVSSDGKGGLTRPEANGQRLALARAYARAGIGIEQVGLFEGHGTGTAVGDATELDALSGARREAAASAAAPIGSVKANIGHTKAASGAAGMIKLCMAMQAGVIPPTTGCLQPHAQLLAPAAALRTPIRAEPWPEGRVLAGINSMGFGGINVHLVMETAASAARRGLSSRERRLDATAQDAELFAFRAIDAATAADRARTLAVLAQQLAQAELPDLAAALGAEAAGQGIRVAVIAALPMQLAQRLETAARRLEACAPESAGEHGNGVDGIFIGSGDLRPRIGFLFPGQGSPPRADGGAWRRRFADVDRLYRDAALVAGDERSTEIAQPALLTASLAALQVLDRLGITAEVAIGHSLGEVAALAWGGAFDTATALRLAKTRGRLMAAAGDHDGAMASVGLSAQQTQAWIGDCSVQIAAFNAPEQTVISGRGEDVQAIVQRLREARVAVAPLKVAQAFHSRAFADTEDALRAALQQECLRGPTRKVVSTVSGALLDAQTDIPALLGRQLTAPVRFLQALQDRAAASVDLWIEVGPGTTLSRLTQHSGNARAYSVDACGHSVAGLLEALAAAYVAGATVDIVGLFDDRAVRPFPFRPRQFLANPCEQAPPAGTAGSMTRIDRDGEAAAAQQAQPTIDTDAPDPPAPLTAANGDAIVRRLVDKLAAKTQLPTQAIGHASRLLSDLHLNSIAVAQLVVETAQSLGLPAPASPTDFADASVEEVALALAALDPAGAATQDFPDGLADWVRGFQVVWTERSRDQRYASVSTPAAAAPARWQVIGAADTPRAAELQRLLEACATGPGVALLLDAPDATEPAYALLVEAAQRLAAQRDSTFLVIHGEPSASGFARTLHLERDGAATVVVQVPFAHPQALAWAVSEAEGARGFVEVRYHADGRREEPQWQLLGESAGADLDFAACGLLGRGDVLLVSGGGYGIAAECALAIARETGCTLALFGRSQVERNDELRRNLERFSALGVVHRYYVADVVDAQAVAHAVACVERDLGRIVAILHGAGVNRPRLSAHLDTEDMRRTVAPKLIGLRHLLDAVNADALRLLVSFGSIIARTGLAGAADYALANACLSEATAAFGARHRHCRCLAIEWSVWSGVGMGERLGTLQSLLQQGIAPITVDAGIGMLRRLLARTDLPPALVVCGRFGAPPTVRLQTDAVPFLRFVERVRFHVPGVEMVVDAELSAQSDPYLRDHVYHAQSLFPAVLGLEAMCQVALALTGLEAPPTQVRFDDVRFLHAIPVAATQPLTLRIVALRQIDGAIDLALRCATTAFKVDHFRARCRFADMLALPASVPSASDVSAATAPSLLDPATQVYGTLLPHGPMFQLLHSYQRLGATYCDATIAQPAASDWFGRTLPAALLLGDPAVRDTAIHALQACIPHKSILPTSIARLDIRLDAEAETGAGPRLLHAQERRRDGNYLEYDLTVMDARGRCLERWEALGLQTVAALPPPTRWPLPLLAPYLERRAGELLDAASLRVALEPGPRGQGLRVSHSLLGATVDIRHRPDGKPIADNGGHLSHAYAENLVLAAAAALPMGVDLQGVSPREAALWQGLLGARRFALAEQWHTQSGEDLDAAATRIWTALESLKKAGAAIDAPLTVEGGDEDEWILLRSGRFLVASAIVVAAEVPVALGVALAMERAG